MGHIVIKVEGLGIPIKSMNIRKLLILAVGIQQRVDASQTLVVLNAIVDDIDPHQPDVKRIDQIVKHAEGDEGLGAGRIHLVVLQIRQQKVAGRLELRHQGEVSVLPEDWLDKERTERRAGQNALGLRAVDDGPVHVVLGLVVTQPHVLDVLRFELLLLDHLELHDLVELAGTGEAEVAEGAAGLVVVVVLDLDTTRAGARHGGSWKLAPCRASASKGQAGRRIYKGGHCEDSRSMDWYRCVVVSTSCAILMRGARRGDSQGKGL